MAGRIERVLRILEEAGVRYLVVGGVAVVLHGHLRTTADLDLMLDLEIGNARRALRALARAGFRPRAPVDLEEFADPAARQTWIEEKNMEVFSLWHPELPGFEVDLFATQPIDFETAHRRRVEIDAGGFRASVVSLDDLIAMKRLAGRPTDQLDVSALEAIRQVEAMGDGGE